MNSLRIFPIFALIFLSGCAYTAEWWVDPNKIQEHYFEHEVRYRGENLSLIAFWYTGRGANWPIIHRSNPGLDIHGIEIGQRILIPRTIVRRTTPLKKSSVQLYTASLSVSPKAKSSSQFGLPYVSAARGVAEGQVTPAHLTPDVYSVDTIQGCEGLPNTPGGLNSCADILERELNEL